MTIAVAQPGKHGDFLWAFPLCRYLWKTTGERIAVHTSSYCAPLENLCLAQAWCSAFIMPAEYVIADMGCGCQPPWMPIPEAGKYSAVYQCGFTTTPTMALHDWMSSRHGFPTGLPIEYDTPNDMVMTKPYIVLASRGPTTFRDLFIEFIDACPIQVVEIGGRGDQCNPKSMNCTGADYLLTAGIIKHAKAFVGLMSSQLVLANGFPIPRIAAHNGGWDMRHILRSEWNHYPLNPSVSDLLRLCGV